MRSTRIARLALAAVLMPLAACSENITGESEQIGENGLNFNLDVSGARGAPAGAASITAFTPLQSRPLTNPDAFRRSGTAGGAIGYGVGCDGGLSGTNTWCFTSWTRDSIGDPRAPTMAVPGFAPRLSTLFTEVGGPEFFGTLATPDPTTKAFELFMRLEGVKPSAVYSISLVRYGLIVKGELDAAERLIHGRVTAPDSLVLIEPGSDYFPVANRHTFYNWTSPNSSCNNKLTPIGVNPFYLGTATSTSSTSSTPRRLTFDKCWSSFGRTSADTTRLKVYYTDPARVKPDSAPFIRNSIGPRTIPQQYNYIEVTDTVTKRVIARVQVGADLDPVTGQVLPNAFAPFPSAALTAPTLISDLKVAEGGPVGLTMRVLPLEELQTGSYELRLFNRETGQTVPVNAHYQTIRRDTTGRDEFGNFVFTEDTSARVTVGEIPGGAGNVTHILTTHDSLNPGVEISDYTDLVLVPPTTPNVGGVWMHYADRNNTDETATDDRMYLTTTVETGRLPAVAAASVYSLRLSGTGTGTARSDQFSIRFQHLPRPPAGFVYNVWLIPKAGSSADTISLGTPTTPLPEEASLEDADIAPAGGVITPTEILEALLLVRPDRIRSLGIDPTQYGTVRLTLENKSGVPLVAPWVILEGPFFWPGQ